MELSEEVALELEALRAIYGVAAVHWSGGPLLDVIITTPHGDGSQELKIVAAGLPPGASERLAAVALERAFCAGEASLFPVIEHIRDALRPETHADTQPEVHAVVRSGGVRAPMHTEAPQHATTLVQSRTPRESPKPMRRAQRSQAEEVPPKSASPTVLLSPGKVCSSEVLVDRRSVFQAHAAEVHSKAEVEAFMSDLLLRNPKIAKATHNILAYRFVVDAPNDSKAKPFFVADCDSDGEDGAGSRLSHLLNILDATNVAVVVTRWYGGVPLGPDRFRHINNVARRLLVETGLGLQKPRDKQETGKLRR